MERGGHARSERDHVFASHFPMVSELVRPFLALNLHAGQEEGSGGLLHRGGVQASHSASSAGQAQVSGSLAVSPLPRSTRGSGSTSQILSRPFCGKDFCLWMPSLSSRKLESLRPTLSLSALSGLHRGEGCLESLRSPETTLWKGEQPHSRLPQLAPNTSDSRPFSLLILVPSLSQERLSCCTCHRRVH